MILQEITVENFRGYRGPVTVKLDGAHTTLVQGKNGSGKSTLLEAALRALADRHDVGGKEAARIRTRGTTLAPRVTVIFEHAGDMFRVAKRFLDSPSARLEKCAGNKFELVEEGRSADQRVRDMLRSDAAGRGLAAAEDTGILQALCCPQGGLALPGLTGKVLEDVRAMLGAQLAGPRGAAFETEVEKKYNKAWAATRPRRTEAINGLRAELTMAQAELERCRAGLAQIAQYQETATEARWRRAGLLDELHSVDRELVKADEDAGRMAALETKRQLADGRWKLADAEYRRIADVIRRIAEANESKRKLLDLWPEIESALENAKTAFEAAKQRAEAAQARFDEISTSDPQFDALCRMADEAVRFNAASAELDALEKRIRRIQELEQLRDGVDRQIAALNAPDREAWKKIQAAAGEQEKARANLDALALRVAVKAERGLEFEVETGDPAGRMVVGPGGDVDLRGEGEVRFRMPGVAAFRISGPAGDAAVWRQRLASAGEQLAALTAVFHTGDLAELARRVDEFDRLNASRTRLQADLDAQLDRAALKTLTARADELVRLRRDLCSAFPEWETKPPDGGALKAAREARRSERDAAAKAARETWQKAEAERSAAEGVFTKAAMSFQRNREDIGKAEAELTALTADGKPAGDHEQDLVRRRRECESAETEMEELARELALLPPDAVERAAALHRCCGELQEQAARAERTLGDAEAGARALLAHGPYEVLSDAEERAAELERRCDAEQFRLDSIRRLHETLEAAKARALQGITEPVEAAATKILDRIAGRRFAQVQLGEALDPDAVVPGSGQGKSGIGELSGGEQEQVYLATRFALADVLTRDKAHTVVLDDVLLNTDDERLGRVLELIEERAGRMRFLILTCHPERYSALENARRITLENFEVRE